MNKLTISAYLALIYGIGLICFETFVNWGQWQWWPFWLVDYVAAFFLILGGFALLRKKDQGPKLLCAGWGFTLAMLWMSLAGNISNGMDPNRDDRVLGLYLGLTLFSIILSLTGLIFALANNKKQS